MNDFELLSPAGSVKAFKAAILAGANAIYFGVENFNARARADNISLEKLVTLLPLAKSRNIKSYLTLNVLIKENEFEELKIIVEKAIKSGIDAIIVQDVGLADFLHKNFPALELHASTQQTTHNIAQCDFLKTFGYSQVNLSRELSYQELVPICQHLEKINIIPEIFIHGAFCISYSGQCYFSKSLCEKSANRGECVQPCRRDYFSSNKKLCRPFNLKDNSLFSDLKKLSTLAKKISLKIEGRIKSESYVWAVTSAWKDQIACLKNELPLKIESQKLNDSMNRMFSDGYFTNDISVKMFSDRIKDHSLKFAGIIESFFADKKELLLNTSCAENFLQADDNVSIFDSAGEFVASGKIIKKIKTFGSEEKEKFYFQFTGVLQKKLLKGQKVFQIPQVINESVLQKEISELKIQRVPINAKVNVERIDNELFLTLVFYTKDFSTKKVVSKDKLTLAKNNALSPEVIKEKLSLLGNTDYILEKCVIENLTNNLFLSFTELNCMRRNAVELLDEYFKTNQKSCCNLQKEEIYENSFYGDKLNNCKNLMLFDTVEKLNFVKKQNSIYKNIVYALQLPLSDDDLKNTEQGRFIVDNPDVIPYFSSILFERDFNNCLNFIYLLQVRDDNKVIWIENTGLAYAASKLGFYIIAGSLFNICNSKSLLAYSKRMNLSGFVFSSELTEDDMLKIDFSGNIKFIYPYFFKPILFSSRNCLVRNLPDYKNNICKKNLTDRKCVLKCEKQCSFSSITGEALEAIKEKGNYSVVVKDKIEVKNKIKKELKDIVDIFLFDFRYLSLEEIKLTYIFKG